MRPRRCCCITRAADEEQLMRPLTFTENTRSITSSVDSITLAIGCATPALLARMSRPPCSPAIAWTAASTPAASVTSSSIAPPLRPSGLAGRESATGVASITSAQTTTAPSRASARAIPSPRPRAEPVTRAVRLSSRPISLAFRYGARDRAAAHPVSRPCQETLTTSTCRAA